MRPRRRRNTALLLATLAVAALLASSCRQSAERLDERRIPIEIGETSVDVVIQRSEEPGLTYLNLHDDENTAVEAALAIARDQGGEVIELQHTGERIVSFAIGSRSFAVDPNRIFTAPGIDSTLARHGAVSEAAHEAVAGFADSLLAIVGVDDLTTVVTIHNNSNGGYSAREYTDDGPYAGDARFVHITPDVDPDDFFFVTTQELYDALRQAGFNVVMQDNALVTDDGSLSVLAGNRGLPYVNAEAEHGHFEAQRRMLAHLHELLDGGRQGGAAAADTW